MSGRRSTLGFVCFSAALVLTLWALIANHITLASSDYGSVIVQAILGSIAALVLIGVGWKHMPVGARVLSVVMALATLWVLIDAGGRRLPALLD